MEIIDATPVRTVLVVDDDPGIRNLLATWIGAMGFNVRVAGDAETALREIEAHDIHVALCDVRMPGPDGLWLADHIHGRSPSTAVVFATGLTELDAQYTLRAGVVGYLLKPFRRDDVKAVLAEGFAWNECAKTQAPDPLLLLESFSI